MKGDNDLPQKMYRDMADVGASEFLEKSNEVYFTVLYLPRAAISNMLDGKM